MNKIRNDLSNSSSLPFFGMFKNENNNKEKTNKFSSQLNQNSFFGEDFFGMFKNKNNNKEKTNKFSSKPNQNTFFEDFFGMFENDNNNKEEKTEKNSEDARKNSSFNASEFVAKLEYDDEYSDFPRIDKFIESLKNSN